MTPPRPQTQPSSHQDDNDDDDDDYDYDDDRSDVKAALTDNTCTRPTDRQRCS